MGLQGKCATLRELLLNKEGFIDSVEAKSARSHETHQLAAQNEMKNKKAHSAFGIREDYQPGAAFTEGKSSYLSSVFCTESQFYFLIIVIYYIHLNLN